MTTNKPQTINHAAFFHVLLNNLPNDWYSANNMPIENGNIHPMKLCLT
jgi:hypothetical protein